MFGHAGNTGDYRGSQGNIGEYRRIKGNIVNGSGKCVYNWEGRDSRLKSTLVMLR
jgi:nitrous oxidase accessory protein NosD